MLDSEWDTYDGNAEDDAKHNVCESNLNSTKNYPYDIHQDR